MNEREWDLQLFKKMQGLSKEFKLKCPVDSEFLNTDDDAADRAFEAALKFIVETGVYCISTNRVVRFTEDEVRDALRQVPREVPMGEGRDKRVFKQRRIEGREPLNIVPGHHAPFTEDLAPLVVKNFAQIARSDFIEGFNFPFTDGREVYGMPLEAYASRREAAWMREGVRKAGRPGMAIVLYPISPRASTLISAIDPDCGLRRTDGVLLSILPDVKMEYDLLTAAMVFNDYGFFGVNGSFGMIGGFCGGPEGAIIEGIVKPIIAFMVYRDMIHYTGVEHLAFVSGETIMYGAVDWARSVVFEALVRNTNSVVMLWNITCSELCTEVGLIESVVRSIEAPLCGANLYAPRVSRPRMNAGQTPLEPEFMIEVSDAVIRAKLSRVEANRMLRKLTVGLNGKPPVPGKTIQACYDLVRHQPSLEYQQIRERVRKRLIGLGLEFA